MTEVGGPGSLTIAGRVSEPAAVTVNGVDAQMSLNGLDFAATIPVITGQNTLSITAMETQASSPGLNLQSTTGSVSVNIADETRRTLTYDANGSTATDSLGRTYEWDRANGLKAIAYSGPGNKRTEFSYDSSSRWNRIVERDNRVVTSDKRFFWDGFKIAEERDSSGNVTKRYFHKGLQDVTASQNSFYGLDHLGSVRSITDAAGALQTHLQFDPWGRRNESPFNGVSTGFTGHYHYKHRDEVPGNNVSDGLELAPFRAYEGGLARWKSRDPIEERGGLNLYTYVWNASVNFIDPLGLKDVDVMTTMGPLEWYTEGYPARYNTVEELVPLIKSKLGGGKLDRLTIHAHSGVGGQTFGKNSAVYGNRTTTPTIQALQELRKLFSSKGAIVFAQCYAGAGEAGKLGMQVIADITGVPVVASEGLYNELNGFEKPPFVVVPSWWKTRK